MNIFTKRISTRLVLLLATCTAVFGCGVMPEGQARSRSFTVRGFTLPVNMVYSTTPKPQVPGIATSRDAANSAISRLIMQTVIDVLEQQGRRAGLPDAIISTILNQLTVRISYNALECKTVSVDQPLDMIMGAEEAMRPNCIIVRDTVTSLCTQEERMMCVTNMKIESIPTNHTLVSGTLTTTNVIMANWSMEMWQNVVNRAVRMLASGPLGKHFFTAVATVN
ncbi:hypothetical protein KIN20_014337 [Parelaphostrongylus tenuis]|uniref:Lipoprotein n=1 Tax=Parelaphostrongylus tenuis TaxID=148309 RepID=A0AAD5QRS3_PARTN|nr:hypothetical protein KIN20_014337 [Parelaphostrongylus tenuis]